MFQAEGMASRMEAVASRNEDGDLEGPARRVVWLQHESREDREGRQESKAGLSGLQAQPSLV